MVLACRAFRVVKLAHAACADSQIIELDAAAMRTLAGLTTAPQHGQQAQKAGRQLRRGENHPTKKCPA
jgi:hypothetical protein